MPDPFRRLHDIDRQVVHLLLQVTAPTTAWHHLSARDREVRRRWLMQSLPLTVATSLLLSLLGATAEVAAPLGLLGAALVALTPLAVLRAAYLRRFELDR